MRTKKDIEATGWVMDAIYAHLRQAWRRIDDQQDRAAAGMISAVVGGFAVAVPLLLTLHGMGLSAGLAMSLGALSVARVEGGENIRARLRGPAAALIATSLAIGVAANAAGHGLISQVVTVLVAAASVLLIRYSKEVAIGVIRFMLYLIIFANALEGARDPSGFAFVIFFGALWAGLFVMLVNLLKRGHGSPKNGSTPDTSKSREPTIRSRLARMRRELRQLSTWDFPCRLALGLCLSLVIRTQFITHHFAWITITIALLTPRQFEAWPVRATQRALGTLVGVVIAALLLLSGLGHPALIFVVLVLGSLRKWFEDRNYLAYSATMAPLVLLLLSASQGDPRGLLEDRILSTLIGVMVVLFCNQVAARTTMAGRVKSTT